MTEPDQAVISRLSADFATMASYLARASADLRELQRIMAERAAPQPVARVQAPFYYYPPQYPPQHRPQYAVQPAAYQPPAAQVQTAPAHPDGWIGKVLAVAGVAVTLVGVVLLLVLAAQAGILRPEFRVTAGAVLAVALVGVGWWLNTRPGGRVGAIALAATGIAAAYMDVIAVTTIYGWVTAPVGLVLAAVVAGGGLTLARRWDSEHLGLLVLVPLIGLAPVVTDGITLLLVGFMLALSAATLLVQLGKDWTGLHTARVAAATLPLLVALAVVPRSSGNAAWVAGACGIAAALSIVSALVLLPRSSRPLWTALLASAGTLPVLAVSAVADRVTSALSAGVLAAVLLAIALLGDRLPNLSGSVRQIWSALSAVAALIAVAVAFDGPVAAPLLLAMAAVVAVAGRSSAVARWCAMAFGVAGALYYLGYAAPEMLITPTTMTMPVAVSTLIASLLVVGCAAAITWSWIGKADDVIRLGWAAVALIGMYAITMFTVTAGALFGGEEYGFFAGHVAATICWVGLAAGVFRYAAKLLRDKRSVPIGAGMALVAAAMAKLFLFDLGTLDGIFRVVVFIVVGLVLLGMGAGYARLLAQQDQQEQQPV
ncbi:DUF2339 domain-containing protein [Mycolicibacterium sp. P9-64]|uniref:DUF2339 domain-containing protein n=1 Tax=Mycolicibacterium sp. P9-64 TaxID=2024612 RepID=UPI0011ED1C59|nr:DUF2339 domain-containing protein [Mycolicibacterium sp. P9-64]KAA0084197.1 DUF2339 domain-containing protein [Mycolicibacterium sp. P9-64]